MSLGAFEDRLSGIARAGVDQVDEACLTQHGGEPGDRIDVAMAVLVEHVVDRLGGRDARAAVDRGDEVQVALRLLGRLGDAQAHEPLEVGRDDPEPSPGREHAERLARQRRARLLGHVLDHVLAEHGLERVVGQWKPSRRVHVDRAAAAAGQIDIHPTGERVAAAADVQPRRRLGAQVALHLGGLEQAAIDPPGRRLGRRDHHCVARRPCVVRRVISTRARPVKRAARRAARRCRLAARGGL